MIENELGVEGIRRVSMPFIRLAKNCLHRGGVFIADGQKRRYCHYGMQGKSKHCCVETCPLLTENAVGLPKE